MPFAIGTRTLLDLFNCFVILNLRNILEKVRIILSDVQVSRREVVVLVSRVAIQYQNTSDCLC